MAIKYTEEQLDSVDKSYTANMLAGSGFQTDVFRDWKSVKKTILIRTSISMM